MDGATAITTSDYYLGTLAGRRTDLSNGVVAPGWYRIKNRDKTWGPPLAIWSENGKLFAKVGNEPSADITESEQEFFAKSFMWAARHPITHDVYWHWRDHGEYPDLDPLAVEAAPKPDAPENERAVPGDNSGNDAEAYRDLVASASAGAEAYKTVADDAAASKAQSLRSRLLEIAGEIEDRHKVEKQPHLDAGRAVDAKWLPLAKDAKAVANTIRDALSRYETEKARAVAQARREAEETARRAAEAGKPAQAPPAPVPEPVKPTPIRGGYGRTAAVREVRVARVVDQDKAYEALKTSIGVVEAIRETAQAIIKAGGTVPGVEIETERRVA